MSSFNDRVNELSEAAEESSQRLSTLKYILQKRKLDKAVSPVYYNSENDSFDASEVPGELASAASTILQRWYSVAGTVVADENKKLKLTGRPPVKLPKIEIVWVTDKGTEVGMRDAYGWVHPDNTDTIYLNPIAIALEGIDILKGTIPHELAHILTYIFYGYTDSSGRVRPHHGVEWQNMCKRMGFPPSRYAIDANDIPPSLR